MYWDVASISRLGGLAKVLQNGFQAIDPVRAISATKPQIKHLAVFKSSH